VLEGLLADPDERLYVLSSSKILNYSILNNAHLVLGRDRKRENQFLRTYDVDKRDGFPSHFFTAKYVVIADPVQYTLKPEDQRIIGVPAKAILNRENIGTAYRKLPYEFALDNNVNVYIFERVRPFKKNNIESLLDIFRKHYPDRKKLYEIDIN
jgi:hypothetical protein